MISVPGTITYKKKISITWVYLKTSVLKKRNSKEFNNLANSTKIVLVF